MDQLNLHIRQGHNITAIQSQIHRLSPEQALSVNRQQKTLVHELLVTRRMPFDVCKQLIRYFITEHFSKMGEKGRKVLSSRDDAGNTVIHYACLNEGVDTQFLNELIDACVEDIVNVGNNYDWTPLHTVSNHGNEELVKYLLKRGANKDARNKFHKDAREVARLNLKDHIVHIFDSMVTVVEWTNRDRPLLWV